MVRKLASLLAAAFVLFAGCGQDPLGDSNSSPMSLRLDMSGAPAAVTQVVATLTRDGFPNQVVDLNITGNTAAGNFADVAIGVWHLRVDALDDADVVLFTGETDVEVLAGAPTLVDLFLNPANGSIQVNVRWGPGEAGNALHVDGVDDYAEAPDSPSLDALSTAITMEAWCRPNDQFYNTVFAKGSKTWGIEFAQGLRPGFLFRGLTINFAGAEDYYGRLNLFGAVGDGQWVHLACTWSPAAGLKVYKNGVEIYTTTATGAFDPGDINEPFRIGMRVGPYSEPFKGDIDEVRIWSVVRTGAEIAADYDHELQGNEPGLVAYYKFNEAPGSTVAEDATSNNNDAALANGALLIPSGAF